MLKESIQSDFAMMAGAVIAFFTALLLLVCVPIVHADKPANPASRDRHTRAFVSGLEQDQRHLLQQSITISLNRFSSKDNPAAIPDYQIYHSIFLEVLMNPLLVAGLPARDLDLIRALPAHSDGQFVSLALDAMSSACSTIKRSNAASPAVVNIAINGVRQARDKIARQLNTHYRAALDQLSDTGKQLVESEYARLLEQDSLVYTELDLDTLGFAQPEFVLAFLQDSCANAERVLPELATDRRTLQDQLHDDYHGGAIQLFQPR